MLIAVSVRDEQTEWAKALQVKLGWQVDWRVAESRLRRTATDGDRCRDFGVAQGCWRKHGTRCEIACLARNGVRNQVKLNQLVRGASKLRGSVDAKAWCMVLRDDLLVITNCRVSIRRRQLSRLDDELAMGCRDGSDFCLMIDGDATQRKARSSLA